MVRYINESLPKNEREGQIGINNQGLEMRIKKYRGSNDIDVEFLIDKSVSKNKIYQSFLTGQIQNKNFPSIQFIDRTGERRQNNAGDWMEIVECFGTSDNTVKFDDDKRLIYNITWSCFDKGQVEHPIRYEETIAYHIECELGLNLYDIINMKKCKELGLDPYEISYGSSKKLWFLCDKMDYHNDFDGYECSCSHFFNNNRCPYCVSKKIHPKDSFAQKGVDKYGYDFLDKYWNWEKNNELGINPWKISPYTNKKVWLYCQNNDYHNYDRNGNKTGYYVSCSDFTKGNKCGYCNPFASHKTHWMDSLAYNRPDIAKSIAIPKNNLTFEDCYNISCYSNIRVYVSCLYCNGISKNKKQISTIVKGNVGCEYCSDGITIPNKILRQISKQLNLGWVFEYSPSWLKVGNSQYRFDAYDDKLKIAIEADANCRENHKGERKEIDDWKDKMANEHGIEVIRIDLMNKKEYDMNTLEYIKQKIYISLNDIYNLDKMNWNEAFIESQKSLMIEACRLWQEEKIYSTNEIGILLKIEGQTVRKYLKRGYELGICSYTPEKAFDELGKRNSGINNCSSYLYWVIKLNNDIYLNKPLCLKDIYSEFNISKTSFDKYIKPYNKIDINKIQGNNISTKQTREKLTPFNGWQFIPLSKEEKQQYLESINNQQPQ